MSEAPASAPIVATGEAAPSPVVSASPEPKPKHRVKVDNQEVEIEYDELVRGYQKGRSADQKYQEAAKLRKEAAEVQEAFNAGDFKVLSEKLKIPQGRLREMSENYLIELLKFDGLSEPEKRALIAERERDEIKKERETEKSQREAKEAERISYQAAEFIDSALGDAIKASGQKVTPVTVARIASFLQAALSQDGQAIDEDSVRKAASVAVKKAYGTLDEEIRTRFSDMSAADAKAILPKRLLDELRKASVDEVLSQDPTWSRKARESGSQPTTKPHKKLSTDEWFAERAKRLG